MMEKGIVVGININNEKGFAESIEELKKLCFACNIVTIGEIIQNTKHLNKATYMGIGKLEELKDLVLRLNPDVVVFNNELTGSQLRNIEECIECRVVDRTTLILDIFAERAKTREAKLQVEVAKLQYQLPRIIGSNDDLGRQGNGVGRYNRGAGETKLELDKRKIQSKINDYNEELEILKSQRDTQRHRRKKSEIPTVALVGYTNSGKSTLLNCILDKFGEDEDKKVFEKDMLFATLDTSVRNIKLDDNKRFFLSDTVGFVSNLPHNLIKAFRSTLEEVCEADLLLNIIDISNEDYENMMDVTSETLRLIGASNIPIINVFNKMDLIQKSIKDNYLQGVYISAKTGEGIDNLIDDIRGIIFSDYVVCNMYIPYDKGNILSYLNDNTKIISKKYSETGTLLTVECSNIDFKKFNEYAQ